MTLADEARLLLAAALGRDELALGHTTTREVGGATLVEVDQPWARGALVIVEADLELAPFRAAFDPAAGGYVGKGAPPDLLRELPERWAAIGAVGIAFEPPHLSAWVRGYHRSQRERAVGYATRLGAELVAWARHAPRHWTSSPTPRPMHELIDDVLGWLAPVCARVGDELRARLTYDDLTGDLRIGRALTFEAALPAGDDVARLSPQRRGLAAWWRLRGELEVGDARLDDAWVIEAPPSSSESLLAWRPPLLALRANAAQVRVESTHLRVEAPLDFALLAATLAAAAELWRTITARRRGLREA